MLISYRWLGRHVDLEGTTPQEVAEALTIHTAEVEGLEPFAPWLADVVVGHVLECDRHPDADKLSVCSVDVGGAGDGNPLQIVCGAPNIAQGQHVAVARVGTVLPGDFKIKKSKIRGVESRGMICSVRELELGEDHSGIWVLPDGVQIGKPVADEADLRDWVIEIDNKSLTHRPDLWGHRGIAGEIAAIQGRSLKPLDLTLPATEAGEAYPVRVESEACTRYIGLPIDGVRNGPSPVWMRNLLLAVGQRPLDLLVDLSNFVMFDLGQPNHLFDRRRLSAEGIVVRQAADGETMTTLDDVQRSFTCEDMLITSGGEAVAVAGVMGGEGSKVGDETGELLLEAASFLATPVRRTAARLGLRTDASARFEKSLDPTLPEKAAAHMVHLLRELQPDIRLPRPAGDAGSWKDPACEVQLRCERVRSVLGAPVEDEFIRTTLTRLGFGVSGEGTLTVQVPSNRATKDVGIEEDLIEEVGRVYGYGNIEERSLESVLTPAPHDARRNLVRALQDRLSGAAAFHEVMTHSFQSEELVSAIGLRDEPYVEVVNPVVESEFRVRRSVLPSLIGLLELNRRNRDEVRLYEIGKGYRIDEPNERGEPRELHQLALAWIRPRSGSERFGESGIQLMRGVVEDLFDHADRVFVGWEPGAREAAPPWAHPGKWLTAGPTEEPHAVVGELEPGLAVRLGLRGELDGEITLAEISLDGMLSQPEAQKTYRSIPRFPGVKVDVALAVPESLFAEEAAAAIERAGKGLVEGLELFDLYRGESVGAGRKSLAYHVLLQSPTKTLTDKEVSKFFSRLEKETESLGGELRRE